MGSMESVGDETVRDLKKMLEDGMKLAAKGTKKLYERLKGYKSDLENKCKNDLESSEKGNRGLMDEYNKKLDLKIEKFKKTLDENGKPLLSDKEAINMKEHILDLKSVKPGNVQGCKKNAMEMENLLKEFERVEHDLSKGITPTIAKSALKMAPSVAAQTAQKMMQTLQKVAERMKDNIEADIARGAR